MMKVACFLAALALCTASAPPRISLVLNQRIDHNKEHAQDDHLFKETRSYKDKTMMPKLSESLQEDGSTKEERTAAIKEFKQTHFSGVTRKLKKAHGYATGDASYSEACQLMSSPKGCVFPIAKGFDADYGVVKVTTTIYEIDEEQTLPVPLKDSNGKIITATNDGQEKSCPTRGDHQNIAFAEAVIENGDYKGAFAAYQGPFIWRGKLDTEKACQHKCVNKWDCVAWTFNADATYCYLMDSTHTTAEILKKAKDMSPFQQAKNTHSGTCVGVDTFKNAEDVERMTGVKMLSKVGAYLFEYNSVADAAGETAEAVTFFLLVNDISPPKFTGTECAKGAEADAKGASGIIQAVNGAYWDKPLLDCMETGIQCSDYSKPTKKTCEDKDGNNISCRKINYSGDLIQKNEMAFVTMKCTDNAGLYGKHGENNVATQHFHWKVIDATPPQLHYETYITGKNGPKYLECNYDAKTPKSVSDVKDFAQCTDGETVPTARSALGNWQNVRANRVGPIHVALRCADSWGNDVEGQQTFDVVDTTPPEFTMWYKDSIYTVPIEPKNAFDSKSVSDVGTRMHDEVKYDCKNHNCMIDLLDIENQGQLKAHFKVTDKCAFELPNTGEKDKWGDANRHAIKAAWATKSWKPIAGHQKDRQSCKQDFCPSVPGTYTRIFTATDKAGNSASFPVDVKLTDKQAPMILAQDCDDYVKTVKGGACRNSIQQMSAADVGASRFGGWKDHGAKCTDFVDGDLSAQVKITGDIVDLTREGEYTITYSCKDYAENEISTTRVVEVFDHTPPTLFFNKDQGDSYVVHQLAKGNPYVDAGVTYQDHNHNKVCVMDGQENCKCKASSTDDFQSVSAANCPITEFGNTVADAGKYFMKQSCAHLPAGSEDGAYVITPEVGGTAKEMVRRHAICYTAGNTIYTIIPQRVSPSNVHTFDEATARCDRVMKWSKPLKLTQFTSEQKEQLGWLIPSKNTLTKQYSSLDSEGNMSGKAGEQLTIDSQLFTDKKSMDSQWLCALQSKTRKENKNIKGSIEGDHVSYRESYKGVSQLAYDIHNGGKDSYGTVGLWVITYVGKDGADNQGFIHRTVEVVDNAIPVITLYHPQSNAPLTSRSHKSALHAEADKFHQSQKGRSGERPKDKWGFALMAESTSANGYFLCAIASAVAGVALLSFSSKKSQTMVPV
jgi:hypothetical protein